jgi:hypothetical protein
MIQKLSQNSSSVMEFQSQLDYEITSHIYADNPILEERMIDTWNIKLAAEFHMTASRGAHPLIL